MKSVTDNIPRILLALLIFTLIVSSLGPLGRASRSASVTTAAPIETTQDGPVQPAFNDPTPINIPNGGNASPYPSTIDVSNKPGIITKVTVTLAFINHPRPDDIDVLLVGPTGQTLKLMSDAGGTNAVSFTSPTFDDSGQPLADEGPLFSLTYHPVDYSGGDPDTFSAPAPPGPYGSPGPQDGGLDSLADFNGTSPNGTWSLYVTSDGTGGSGSISGGWQLSLTTKVYQVTNLNDSGAGSLRQAIADASPGSTINIDPSLRNQTITLTSGELVINKNLTISGSDAKELTISGNNASRVFNVQSGITLNLDNLTISHGNAGSGSAPSEATPGSGGAIVNEGTLSLLNTTITNSVASNGGGIALIGAGSLLIRDSTVTNNTATNGGGIHIDSTHPNPMAMFTSTISNNTASGNGAGIHVIDGDVTVTNSTISGNSATGDGGGVLVGSGGSCTASFTTCASNHADVGGGWRVVSEGNLIIRDSAAAGNFVFTSAPDISGTVSSEGWNDIGNSNGSSGWVASDLLNVDPLLGPLQFNGGPNLTLGLNFGSPAIDAGNGGPPTDQRGGNRAGGIPDIGAFEWAKRLATQLEIPDIRPTADPSQIRAILRLIVFNNEGDPFPLPGQEVELSTIGQNGQIIDKVIGKTDSNAELKALIELGEASFLRAKYPGSPFFLPCNTFATVGLSDSIVPEKASPSGGGCQYLIFNVDESFAANGGAGTINVRTFPLNCNWTAVSNDPWIQITSGAAGTGNGQVAYTVAANTDANARRTGTITVAGLTFAVLQGAAFLDVPQSNIFYTLIGKLSARGVTVGCGGGNYCPSQAVTREQMAAFIIRALGDFNPPEPPLQRFNDVPPSNIFYRFIDEMAVRQITLGCSSSPPLYCPTANVTREQMAAFMIRALGEPNPPEPFYQLFNDVPRSNIFNSFIDRMAVRRITLGCSSSPPMYCPSASVTREQMAAFLVRAFNL